MFIPSAKSKLSLVTLFVISILLFIWVDNSRIYVEQKYFREKIDASKLMETAINTIKEYRNEQGIFIDEVNDPAKTTLIGDRESLIITDRGNLNAKLTSLNPNFAAVMIDYFKAARLKKGDKVVVSCTGSFPAINMAVYAAAKTLELDLTVISSVGASMFGATDPQFTWLDMETLLYDQEIFPYKSVAASLGGGRDLGRGLNLLGREMIVEAIQRNNVELVQESSLEKNIQKKMDIYRANAGDDVDLYVNIGGGLSSLGNSINGQLIKPGINRYIDLKNVPLKGTMLLYSDLGVPSLHLLKITEIAHQNDLPTAPEELPKPGVGKVFEDQRYNPTVSIIALVILVLCILVVIFFDHKELKLKEEEINL